jgi:hypothetical protein
LRDQYDVARAEYMDATDEIYSSVGRLRPGFDPADWQAIANEVPELRPRVEQADEALRRMHSLESQIKGPDLPESMPFKETWHELAMKRLIRYASENDYDKITWTPGDVAQKLVGGDLKGQVGFYGSLADDRALAESLGKNSDFPEDPAWMDKAAQLKREAVVPNWVKKYGKKWGVKVEPTEIVVGGRDIDGNAINSDQNALLNFSRSDRDPRANDVAIARLEAFGKTPAYRSVFGFSIPPQMRSDVIKKGQPLMAIPPLLAMLGMGGGGDS